MIAIVFVIAACAGFVSGLSAFFFLGFSGLAAFGLYMAISVGLPLLAIVGTIFTAPKHPHLRRLPNRHPHSDDPSAAGRNTTHAHTHGSSRHFGDLSC